MCVDCFQIVSLFLSNPCTPSTLSNEAFVYFVCLTENPQPPFAWKYCFFRVSCVFIYLDVLSYRSFLRLCWYRGVTMWFDLGTLSSESAVCSYICVFYCICMNKHSPSKRRRRRQRQTMTVTMSETKTQKQTTKETDKKIRDVQKRPEGKENRNRAVAPRSRHFQHVRLFNLQCTRCKRKTRVVSLFSSQSLLSLCRIDKRDREGSQTQIFRAR